MTWLILFGPAAVLFLVALFGMERGFSGLGIAGVVTASTVAWLAYVALVPHTQGGLTVFGADPRLGDDDAMFFVPLAAWMVFAAIAGWRRIAAPFTIGAAAVAGPFALAYWTTPQGDGDGLWALIFLYLPFLGALAGVLAAVTAAIGRRNDNDARTGMATARVAALLVDVAVVAVCSFAPLAMVSSGTNSTVVFVLGVVIALAYLSGCVAIVGATAGHRLLGLRVVTTAGSEPTPLQALARSVIIVVELFVAMFLVGLTLIPELISLASGNNSFADAVCRTRVVRRTAPVELHAAA